MSLKKGRLSTEEKEFIEDNLDMDVEDIASELSRSVNAVQNHIDSISKEDTELNNLGEEDIEDSTEEDYEEDAGVVILNDAYKKSYDEEVVEDKTSVENPPDLKVNNNGSTVMNQWVSERIDSSIKKKRTIPSSLDGSIHRIK